MIVIGVISNIISFIYISALEVKIVIYGFFLIDFKPFRIIFVLSI